MVKVAASMFALAAAGSPSSFQHRVGLDKVKTGADALAYAERLRARSDGGEQEILKTLLDDRARWHPQAVSLLETVAQRRGRRMSGDAIHTCSAHSTEEDCATGKTDYESSTCSFPCKYDNTSFSPCQDPSCSDYTTEEACCANAHKSAEGCHWSATMKPHWSNSEAGPGQCVSMTCSSLGSKDKFDCEAEDAAGEECAAAKAACTAVEGCQYRCNECSPAHYECDCDEQFMKCRENFNSGDSGDMEDAMGGLMAVMSCPMVQCQKCLSGDIGTESNATTREQRLASPECSAADKCGEVAHCKEEGECLFADDDDDDAEEVICVQPSCLSSLTTTSTTTEAAADIEPEEMCSMMCTASEEKCGSCGDKMACATAVGGAAAAGTSAAIALLLAFVKP